MPHQCVPWLAILRQCVGLSLALKIVIKFLGGGYVQQALVSLSIGNGPLCPKDKSTQHRHVQSVWAIGMLSQGHMRAPLYRYTGQVGPDLGILGHLRTVKMVPLRHGWGWYPPQTASHILIRQIQRVWAISMLSQGHMVAPLYRYTGQVGPDLGSQGHLWSGNDAITSWLRLIYTSDCFIHPY
jgi:hypothetical protein